MAIELAASRVRSLSVRDIARRLDDRFTILQDPSSHRPERRRALEAAIGWSYQLLFPDDQRGLWALSCFAGGASLDAAAHVFAALGVPTASVLDTISRLVDRSLVSVDPVEGGEVRYRLLDSIRAYAAARLRESGQGDLAAAAHAAWYAETAAWCEEHVRSDQQPACLAIARAERSNADVALAWCVSHDPRLGVRIANGFGWTWVVLGDGTAGATRVRTAIVRSDPALATAPPVCCSPDGWRRRPETWSVAQADLDRARTLADELADDVLIADVDRHQAFVALQQGRPELAVRTAAASLATYRPLGLRWCTAASLLLGAYGCLMLGDTGSATRDATEAVGILTPLGDAWGLVHAEAMLGGIAEAEHRFDDAARALRRAAEESATAGVPRPSGTAPGHAGPRAAPNAGSAGRGVLPAGDRRGCGQRGRSPRRHRTAQPRATSP